MKDYIPFDPSMIGAEDLIVWCPDKDDYADLMVLLANHDVKWVSTGKPKVDDPHSYHEAHCVRIVQNKTMWQANREYYEESRYRNYTFTEYRGIEVVVDVDDFI